MEIYLRKDKIAKPPGTVNIVCMHGCDKDLKQYDNIRIAKKNKQINKGETERHNPHDKQRKITQTKADPPKVGRYPLTGNCTYFVGNFDGRSVHVKDFST